MNYTVYKHTSPSGKVYIGITNRDPIKRWGKQGIYYKGSHKFYNDIQKYGWDNIQHEILYTNLSAKEAKFKEIELISHYKAFNMSYNITDGGDGSLGLFPNEETRKKIGDASKNRIPSLEVRQKISKTLKSKNIIRSEETRRKISEKNKGKVRTQEQNEKNRQIHLGQVHSRESIERQRQKMIGRIKSEEENLHISQSRSIPIVQLTKSGIFVSFWESAKIAALSIGGSNSHITACCKGRLGYYKNFIWKYLSDYEN